MKSKFLCDTLHIMHKKKYLKRIKGPARGYYRVVDRYPPWSVDAVRKMKSIEMVNIRSELNSIR